MSMYLIVFHTGKESSVKNNENDRSPLIPENEETFSSRFSNNLTNDRKQTLQENFMKKLDKTNDVFENDLMMIQSRNFSSPRAQSCFAIMKRVLLVLIIMTFTFLQITIAVFKGRTDLFNCLVSITLGVWWAAHMFYFYRKSIQYHIRSILEFNQEFKQEHLIQHS